MNQCLTMDSVQAWYNAQVEYIRPRLAAIPTDHFVNRKDSMIEPRVMPPQGSLHMPLRMSNPKGKQKATWPEGEARPVASRQMVPIFEDSTADESRRSAQDKRSISFQN